MDFALLIFVIAIPFWVSDLVLRGLGIAPPLWLGGINAFALMLVGINLMGRSVLAFRKSRRTGSGIPSPAAPAESLHQGDWERSLPCILHEIKNYSCTLRNNALLLRLQMPNDGVVEPLGRLERTTEKIQNLAMQVLGKVSDGAAVRRPLDMHRLVRGCIVDNFTESMGKFQVRMEGRFPAIIGDGLKMEQVFLNLFRNALEAGAENITVTLAPAPGGLRIQVEDDGQGCDAGQLDQIFRPLYTTKRDRGGTGLGLYMVKAVLESHGGSIRAVSKNLRGGRASGMIFSVTLSGGRGRIFAASPAEPKVGLEVHEAVDGDRVAGFKKRGTKPYL